MGSKENRWSHWSPNSIQSVTDWVPLFEWTAKEVVACKEGPGYSVKEVESYIHWSCRYGGGSSSSSNNSRIVQISGQLGKKCYSNSASFHALIPLHLISPSKVSHVPFISGFIFWGMQAKTKLKENVHFYLKGEYICIILFAPIYVGMYVCIYI